MQILTLESVGITTTYFKGHHIHHNNEYLSVFSWTTGTSE